jgi:hypothetical protein
MSVETNIFDTLKGLVSSRCYPVKARHQLRQCWRCYPFKVRHQIRPGWRC